MKIAGTLLFVAIGLTVAEAFSISGGAAIDKTAASAGGMLTFPRIPGFNVPLFNIFGRRTTTTTTTSTTTTSSTTTPSTNGNGGSNTGDSTNDNGGSNTGDSTNDNGGSNTGDSTNGNGGSDTGDSTNDNGGSNTGDSTNGSGGSGSGDSTNGSGGSNSGDSTNGGSGRSERSSIPSIFDLPDPQSLIPDFSSSDNSTNGIPPMNFDFMDPSQISMIPGVADAIEDAREHVAQALQLGSNFTAGIQQAVENAVASDDPTAALRSMVQTILNAYSTVAENCPFVIVSNRVLQEGIRLAMEVSRSVQNVILGTTTASM